VTFVSDSFKSSIQKYTYYLFTVRLLYARKQFSLFRDTSTQQVAHLQSGGRNYIFSMDAEFALCQHNQTGTGDNPVGTFYTAVMKPEADT
jgi:hypothetical protein